MKKKIILTSILSIAMCLSLICGATFALFTDTDTVNVAVTSGKVNVNAVVAQDGIQVISHGETSWRTENSFANGGFVNFSEGSNMIELNLITPGDAVLFSINIQNLSNIAIRYRTALKVVEGEKLFSALNVYVAEDEKTVKDAMFAADKSTYIDEGILFGGETRVSPWSDPLLPIAGENKTYKTVYVLVEFPYLSTDQSEYMNESAKLAYTVEAVQGNASLDTFSSDIVPIYTLTDLRMFAENVNNGVSYQGKTVQLMDDIDLGYTPWTPIGPNADGPNTFDGTFDGQNHTIKNLVVTQGAAYHAAGLFGAIKGTVCNLIIDGASITNLSTGSATDNGTAVVAGSIYPSGSISNVVVKNAMVRGNRYVGGISGYTYGSVMNCRVENSTIIAAPDNLSGSYDNGDKVGGIAGYFCDKGEHQIFGNAVVSTTVRGYRDIGGIVGAADSATFVINNTAEAVTVTQDNTNGYKSEAITTYGAIVGRVLAGEVQSSNKAENVTVAP